MQVANIAAVGSSTPRRVTVAVTNCFYGQTDTYGRELYVIDLPVVKARLWAATSTMQAPVLLLAVFRIRDTTKQLAKQGPVPKSDLRQLNQFIAWYQRLGIRLRGFTGQSDDQ